MDKILLCFKAMYNHWHVTLSRINGLLLYYIKLYVSVCGRLNRKDFLTRFKHYDFMCILLLHTYAYAYAYGSALFTIFYENIMKFSHI